VTPHGDYSSNTVCDLSNQRREANGLPTFTSYYMPLELEAMVLMFGGQFGKPGAKLDKDSFFNNLTVKKPRVVSTSSGTKSCWGQTTV